MAINTIASPARVPIHQRPSADVEDRAIRMIRHGLLGKIYPAKGPNPAKRKSSCPPVSETLDQVDDETHDEARNRQPQVKEGEHHPDERHEDREDQVDLPEQHQNDG
jgi:hypothetical protein